MQWIYSSGNGTEGVLAGIMSFGSKLIELFTNASEMRFAEQIQKRGLGILFRYEFRRTHYPRK